MTEDQVKSYDSDTDTHSYSIEECLLDSDGVLQSHTIENTPKFESIDELKTELNKMIDSIDKQVIGEIPSNIQQR